MKIVMGRVRRRILRGVSEKDQELIHNIAERAVKFSLDTGGNYTRLHAVMDIASAHLRGPLQLSELLMADDFHFAREISGISTHMDMSLYPGKFTNGFRPYYTAK